MPLSSSHLSLENLSDVFPTSNLRARFNSIPPRTRASHPRYFLLTLLLSSIFLVTHTVKCADEEQNLLQQINSYRTSLNLTALKENSNADCFAEGMANEFKDQACTNNSGPGTVPGTETQFSSYPQVLQSCHLNVTTTRDGAIMPACVPDLVPSLVLSNFTDTQYTSKLNDSQFTGIGIGIGSKNDWIVVILTTDTPEGNYATATNDNGSANLTSMLGLFYLTLVLSVSLWMSM